MRGIALNREINPEFGISQKAAVRILTDSPDGKKEGRTRLSSPKMGARRIFETRATETNEKRDVFQTSNTGPTQAHAPRARPSYHFHRARSNP